MTRNDDNADAIKTRIEIFYQETMPLVEEWKKEGKIISINAEQSIEQVTEELFSKLDPLLK